MLGGVVPPPVFEVNVTDRGFVPATVAVTAGGKVRYRVTGALNHLLAFESSGDCQESYNQELQSPLLRPGAVWILDTTGLPAGSTFSVVDEVLSYLRGTLQILERSARIHKIDLRASQTSQDAQEGSDITVSHEADEGGAGLDGEVASPSDGEESIDGDLLNELLAELKTAAAGEDSTPEEEEEDDGNTWADFRRTFKSQRENIRTRTSGESAPLPS